MFNKPSLKNRFKNAESKLETKSSELKLAEFIPEKARHPEIHAIAKEGTDVELELSHYLRTIKKSFKRPSIPSPSDESLALEEMVSEAINDLTTAPCLLQISHPKETRGSDCYKYFIASLEEYPQLWKLVLKDLTWVSLSYVSNTTVLSFSAIKMDAQKLEGILKSIATKSGSLVSFNLQKKEANYNVQLRLEAFEHKKISNEREAGL